MRETGIRTRVPSDLSHSVHNVDDVVEMAAGWKRDSEHDPAVCDWSWMARQQAPPDVE